MRTLSFGDVVDGNGWEAEGPGTWTVHGAHVFDWRVAEHHDIHVQHLRQHHELSQPLGVVTASDYRFHP